MSLTTDLEIRHIHDYTNLLIAIFEAENKLEDYRDELRNLQCLMSQEDIDKANRQFRKIFDIEP